MTDLDAYMDAADAVFRAELERGLRARARATKRAQSAARRDATRPPCRESGCTGKARGRGMYCTAHGRGNCAVLGCEASADRNRSGKCLRHQKHRSEGLAGAI